MNTQVLVLGEALIDIVIPLQGDVVEHVGGSPANVAVGLARLGHPTTLATHVGTDPRGVRIVEAIGGEGVTIAPGSTDADRTPTAAARLDSTGAASYEFDLDWQLDPGLAVPEAGHLHTGSFSATLEPGATSVASIVERALATCTFSYDPNARPSIMGSPAAVRERVEHLISLADVVKASDEDVAWLYDGADVPSVMSAWSDLGASLVLVTAGGAGAYVRKGASTLHLDAAEVSVADTVGAGDSFMSGVISGLIDAGLLGGVEAREHLRDASLEQVLPAVRRALACAAITVGRAGANPPRRAELPQES